MKRSILVLRIRNSCLFLLLLGAALTPYAQHTDLSRTYHAVSVKAYGIADGLPDKCVQNVLVAPDGRLHVLPCTYTQVAHKLYFYQYDAFRARRKVVNIVPDKGQWSLVMCGTRRDSTMYGYLFENSDPDKPQSGFFTYHSNEDAWAYVPAPLVNGQSAMILGAVEYDSSLFVLGIHPEGVYVFKLTDDVWEHVASSGPVTMTLNIRTAVALFIDDSEIWFEAPQGRLHRISRLGGDKKSESIVTGVGQGILVNNRLVRLNTGELLYAMHGPGKVFQLDGSTFDRIPYVPIFDSGNKAADSRYYLHQDLTGNMIWIREDPNGDLAGWLVDAAGAIHDFTPVLVTLQGALNQRWNHLDLRGTDFREKLWVVGRDLVSLDVSSRSGVSAYASSPARGVVELADGSWVLGRYRTFRDGQETNPDSLLPACFSVMHPDGDIVRLGNGKTLHGTRGSGLRLYNRDSGTCQTFLAGETVGRMCLGPDSVLYLLAGNRLLSLDLDRNRTATLLDHTVDPFVNALFASKDGSIYLGTAEGLFKVDRKNRKLVLLDMGDRPVSQIQCLYEDRRGRLWVGTHSHGLRILDPTTGSVRTVDEEQGLSNNIAAFIREDGDGDIWVGTYHGITIFDQNLNLLGYLYEEGGLIDNECNRWSAYQLTNGHLFIGTPVGFTVVDPSVVKSKIRQWSPPYSYLSEVTTGKETVIYGSDRFEHTMEHGIVIPASDRSVRISYGLSNYASPESSRFAYMLDLPGHDWNHVGALHELNLSDLPAGEYDILIKGYDYTGAESNITSVPLHVKAFFYESWWFYVLCSIPFLAFAVIWVRRQNGERRRLEAAVARRTETIREQAEALRDLDKMKTRLYTNITHEFRTPLTVIRGLADQAGVDEKAPELIKRNADNLLGLVNQMLDLRKIESGNLQLEPVQDDLIRFLRYIGESFRSIAEIRFQQFHFLSEQEGFVMDFDPEKLTRVVSNLLSNAIKFTPEGGDIYLQVDCGSDEAVIKVRDTGIGIPEDKIDRIFERFYQVDDSSTRRGEG
ncbi:MAG: ATP-binding protein, partial [Saprospiraceae bacterium]|nr:ATP-binding protein [Saprospiraceae bacterium]